MSEFAVVPALRIGSIVEVAGTAIRVELDGSIEELTRTYNGKVYPIGQFASVVKIHFGRTVLVAYVRLLRMRSEIAKEEGLPVPVPAEDARVVEADLFGEAVWHGRDARLDFRRGVRNYPLPGQGVYLTTEEELSRIYEGSEKARKPDASPMVPIGHYVGASAVCYADLNKLFGLHCAILGSTGAGKSGAVAALLHSILEHKVNVNGNQKALRPRIVLIDPHGEYAAAFKSRAAVFRAYTSPTETSAGDVKDLCLPYWLMTGEEFREMVVGKTEYEATSENNIVYKALSHARLVQRGLIEAAKAWVGTPEQDIADPAEPRPKPANETIRSKIAEYDRDTPDPFSLDEFVKHIRSEQGVTTKAKKWEDKSTSDFKPYASVLDKLTVIRSDPRLAFMMKEYKTGAPDLPEILMQFVGETKAEADIRIVDISGLPNEVAGPLTATIGRMLFQYKLWQTREERERDPILLVCEEAHRYVPDVGLAEYQAAQKAIRRIAKEGRKYGIGLMLVSQRPSDVERTVLSQCNSWIVLRLTNATDQEHVARFLPDNLSGLVKLLPSLGRQEALFVGEAAAVPARVMIRTLPDDKLPKSNDVAFVKGWAEPPIGKGAVEQVVKRWRKES